jgi:UDP-glucose:(heptosyl)LPS alpha-1,3-glucosyltransferase
MINCNRRDGSARAVNEVAERLGLRHKVDLYARKAEDIDLNKVYWKPVPGPGWPEVVDFGSYHVSVASKLRRGGYEIIHSIGCNAGPANVITIQNIQPAKKEILDRVNKAESVSAPRRLTRWLYLKVTCAAEHKMYTQKPGRREPLFLPVSKGVEAELRAHYDIGSAPVRIIPNAADGELFKPIPVSARNEWRSANGIPLDSVVMTFCGGEWTRKGLDIAIKAMPMLKRSDVVLFIAGDDPDRERYQKLAQECGVSQQVVFGGFRKDVPAALGSSDLFLFPSWYEAFSLATIEAAACGLPIVATRINGTEDFIQPGITGEFIEHDPEQIAAVLTPLLESPEKRREMGCAARRLVEQRYTWDRVAEMTEAAYREYLDGGMR